MTEDDDTLTIDSPRDMLRLYQMLEDEDVPEEIELVPSDLNSSEARDAGPPPMTPMEVDQLRGLDEDALRSLGMREWSDGLWLFPGEWYEHLPEGIVVKDIFDEYVRFERPQADSDTRFGCLSYGIEVEE